MTRLQFLAAPLGLYAPQITSSMSDARAYRWADIRGPVGRGSPDLMVAGQLYPFNIHVYFNGEECKFCVAADEATGTIVEIAHDGGRILTDRDEHVWKMDPSMYLWNHSGGWIVHRVLHGSVRIEKVEG